MDDATGRAMPLTAMMNEQIRSMSPAERNRLTQRFVAEAKTPSERFQTLAVMMNFVIGLNRMRRESRDG
ncbi:MAG: hypothetical protein ACE5F9_02695 [Phycisphaerae bacterium]